MDTYTTTSTLRGRPPFLPLARAASDFAALLWRPLREATTEAAMAISGLLAEIIPTAGIGSRIISPVLRPASWCFPNLRNAARIGKKSFLYSAGT